MKKQSPVKTYLKSLWYGSLIGIGLALIFVAGFITRDLLNGSSVFSVSARTSANEVNYSLLNDVQDLIDKHYLREQPDYQTRQYAAIRGMLASLGDRNTFFIDPPVAQSETHVLAGTYGGVGVMLRRSESGDFVMYPFPESSALMNGVQEGDILKMINGQDITTSRSIDVVDQMLRGEVKDGNGVDITIQRGDEIISFFVPFAVVNVPSIQWRIIEENPSIGYLHIIRFTSRTPSEIVTAIEDLTSYNIERIILDLRDNNGGLLQEAIDVAGIFLGEEVIMIEVTKSNEREFRANPPNIRVSLPMIVLVNGRTASAAELVAGAIQDADRAILIGQKTFGKGTIQQIFRLSDSSSVHITSAEWLTPNRNIIDGAGLNPDILMIPDESGRDVELGEAIRQIVTITGE